MPNSPAAAARKLFVLGIEGPTVGTDEFEASGSVVRGACTSRSRDGLPTTTRLFSGLGSVELLRAIARVTGEAFSL